MITVKKHLSGTLWPLLVMFVGCDAGNLPADGSDAGGDIPTTADSDVDADADSDSDSDADMDADGDIDIMVAEHTDQTGRTPAADNLTLWYENQADGALWLPHLIDIGDRSSHLGARAHDLDKDGDLDLVSIGWQQFNYLHLWQNLTIENQQTQQPQFGEL